MTKTQSPAAMVHDAFSDLVDAQATLVMLLGTEALTTNALRDRLTLLEHARRFAVCINLPADPTDMTVLHMMADARRAAVDYVTAPTSLGTILVDAFERVDTLAEHLIDTVVRCTVVSEQTFSIERWSEGGTSRKEAESRARECGLHVVGLERSPYVGQYGLRVRGTRAQMDAFETALWPDLSNR